ncbi:hypothetical protein [Streptomyces phaeochromogenes]
MPRSCPPEFRREVLDLVAPEGRSPRSPGSELAAARKRIAELEAELAIRLRTAELPGEVTSPKGGSKPSA